MFKVKRLLYSFLKATFSQYHREGRESRLLQNCPFQYCSLYCSSLITYLIDSSAFKLTIGMYRVPIKSTLKSVRVFALISVALMSGPVARWHQSLVGISWQKIRMFLSFLISNIGLLGTDFCDISSAAADIPVKTSLSQGIVALLFSILLKTWKVWRIWACKYNGKQKCNQTVFKSTKIHF